MKRLAKLLNDKKYIMFLDFEGTQFSHEIIAIGGVLCKLKSNGTAVKCKEPFFCYVKSKNSIGKYVQGLTGITDEILQKQGITFCEAMNKLKKMMGLAFKKARFVTFGNHDLRMLNQSFAYNLDSPKEIIAQIQHNYFDFAVFMNEYIRDDKGNPLSLIHAAELFNCKDKGKDHDPTVDAINLMNIYNAFVSSPSLLLDEYKKAAIKIHHLADPFKQVIEKLLNGEPVDPSYLDDKIKDYIS